MKQGIHPEYVECTVRCSCGNTFTTRFHQARTRYDICNVCHPFYTGQQRFVDTGGRVQRFADKFGSAKETVAEREAAKKAAKAAAVAEAEAKKRPSARRRPPRRPSAPRNSPRRPKPRPRRPPSARLPPKRPLPRRRPRTSPPWTRWLRRLRLPRLRPRRRLPNSSRSMSTTTTSARSSTGRSRIVPWRRQRCGAIACIRCARGRIFAPKTRLSARGVFLERRCDLRSFLCVWGHAGSRSMREGPARGRAFQMREHARSGARPSAARSKRSRRTRIRSGRSRRTS